MFLYHYFERAKGPLLNLSDLPLQQAQDILDDIKDANNTFASHRDQGYLERRQGLEQIVRDIFISKGGNPTRKAPHYFVVECCPWLETWYLDASFIKIQSPRLMSTLFLLHMEICFRLLALAFRTVRSTETLPIRIVKYCVS